MFPPAENVQMSEKFKDALDNDVNTDFVLRQYSVKQIEDIVAARLKTAQSHAQEKLEAARGRAETTSASESDNGDSASKLAEQLSELEKTLANRPQRGVVLKETAAARDRLTSCIKANKNQVLDCRAELLAFEREIERQTL